MWINSSSKAQQSQWNNSYWLCSKKDHPSTDMLLYSKLNNLQLKLSSWKKQQHKQSSYFNSVTKIQRLCLQLRNSTTISTNWKACTNKQLTWQQHLGKIIGEIQSSKKLQISSYIQRLGKSLAPLRHITVNKEKVTDSQDFYLSIWVCLAWEASSAKSEYLKNIWGKMGSWTLKKMLFHMTVTDLVPAESWSTVLISPPAICTAFVPRLSLNKQSEQWKTIGPAV